MDHPTSEIKAENPTDTNIGSGSLGASKDGSIPHVKATHEKKSGKLHHKSSGQTPPSPHRKTEHHGNHHSGDSGDHHHHHGHHHHHQGKIEDSDALVSPKGKPRKIHINPDIEKNYENSGKSSELSDKSSEGSGKNTGKSTPLLDLPPNFRLSGKKEQDEIFSPKNKSRKVSPRSSVNDSPRKFTKGEPEILSPKKHRCNSPVRSRAPEKPVPHPHSTSKDSQSGTNVSLELQSSAKRIRLDNAGTKTSENRKFQFSKIPEYDCQKTSGVKPSISSGDVTHPRTKNSAVIPSIVAESSSSESDESGTESLPIESEKNPNSVGADAGAEHVKEKKTTDDKISQGTNSSKEKSSPAGLKRRSSCPNIPHNREKSLIPRSESNPRILQPKPTEKTEIPPEDPNPEIPLRIRVHMESHVRCAYHLLTNEFSFPKITKLREISQALWRCSAVKLAIHETFEISFKNGKIKDWDSTLLDIFPEHAKKQVIHFKYDVVPITKASHVIRYFFPSTHLEETSNTAKKCRICQKKFGLISHKSHWCQFCGEHVCDTCSDEKLHVTLHSYHKQQKQQQKLIRCCTDCLKLPFLVNPFDQVGEKILQKIIYYLEPLYFMSFSMISKHLLEISKNTTFAEKHEIYNLHLCFPGTPRKRSKIPPRNFPPDAKKILTHDYPKIASHVLPIQISLGFCEEHMLSAHRLPHYVYRKQENIHLLAHEQARICHVLGPIENNLIPLGWEVKWRLTVQKKKRFILSAEDWFYKHVEDLYKEWRENDGFLEMEIFLTPTEGDAASK